MRPHHPCNQYFFCILGDTKIIFLMGQLLYQQPNKNQFDYQMVEYVKAIFFRWPDREFDSREMLY